MARVADALRAVTDTVPQPFTRQTADAAPAHPSYAGRDGEHAGRSPVPAMLGSIAAGVALALAVVFGPASGGSEPTISGSVLPALVAAAGRIQRFAVMAQSATGMTAPQ